MLIGGVLHRHPLFAHQLLEACHLPWSHFIVGHGNSKKEIAQLLVDSLIVGSHSGNYFGLFEELL